VRIDGGGTRQVARYLTQARDAQGEPLRLRTAYRAGRVLRAAARRVLRARLDRLRAREGRWRHPRHAAVDPDAQARPAEGRLAARRADPRQPRTGASGAENGRAEQDWPGVRIAPWRPSLSSQRPTPRLRPRSRRS